MPVLGAGRAGSVGGAVLIAVLVHLAEDTQANDTSKYLSGGRPFVVSGMGVLGSGDCGEEYEGENGCCEIACHFEASCWVLEGRFTGL
jgi:hypothetical protein